VPWAFHCGSNKKNSNSPNIAEGQTSNKGRKAIPVLGF